MAKKQDEETRVKTVTAIWALMGILIAGIIGATIYILVAA
jgi:preprotein translocase subunit Sss1